MGAFDAKPPITLPDPTNPVAASAFRRKWGWDDNEQVIIKGALTVAEQIFVNDKYGALKGDSTIDVKMGEGRYALLECMIQSWTFTMNGSVPPVNAVTIRMLPSNYSKPILDAIDAISAPMTEEESENFTNGATVPTVVDSTLLK